MSNKVKTTIIVIIVSVLVVCASSVIYYIKNKMTVYDKDGMVFKNSEIYEQGDD